MARHRSRSRRSPWLLAAPAVLVVAWLLITAFRDPGPADAEPATPEIGLSVGGPAPDTPGPGAADPPGSTAEPPTDDAEARLAAELARLQSLSPAARRRGVSDLLLGTGVPPAQRAQLLETMRRLNEEFFRTAIESEGVLPVRVERGDSLDAICRRLAARRDLRVTPAFLALVNDVRPSRIRAGVTLRVPSGSMSIRVSKSAFRLCVLVGGVHFREFAVGTGRDDSSPEGEFVIAGKTKNPVWTDPETGRTWKYGESGHRIGSRWLGFNTKGGDRTGFGIHGTDEPASIGRGESRGCLRMGREDVELLFDLIPEGTPVSVTP